MITNPRVINVVANDDYTLTIIFSNSEVKTFDVKPYLDFGIFTELKDLNLFKTAHVSMGTVCWSGDQDFCPDTFEESQSSIQQTTA
jgi:hypothetical protein